MFRRSKRDKERRRGSSFNTNDSSDESGSISSQTGSLKRASKLFGFGKKDKRKSLDNGKESPELSNHHDSNGLHVETNHHHGKQGQFSPVQENFPSVSPHHITPLTSNYINGRGTRLDIFVPSTPEMIAEKSRTISESSSLGFEFGTDGSSLNFQDFAADVLKATEEKLKGVDLKLPDLKSPDKEDTSRIVYIDRAQSTGDFGFTIRRSTIDNGSKIVHTIEPTGPDTYGLLPGDRVVEVNDENVENFRRDNIIEKIAKSGITVKLKVVPVPELAEFSARTAALQAHTPTLGKVNFSSAGSLRTKILTKKVLALPKETGDESEKQWTGADKVWLVHKSGFSSGALSKTSNENHDGDKDDENDEGGVDIKLDHGGEVIQKIDESSLEKVNHPKFDNAENLTSLTYLNESGCLHTLRQRYGGNLVHTYAGNNLIVIKPKHPLSAYTKQVMDMFRGCKQEDMPPHIFAMAQTSYRSMLASHVNQSIILQGNAGSGKSFNAKQLLGYLTSVTVSEHNTSIGAKLSAAQSIVESFISARTKLSRNATFAYNLYSLNFDVYGLVIGASIENYMFDKNRLTRVLPGESTFRIFYELLDSGDMPLLQELGLDLLKKEESIFFDFDQQFSTFERHQEKWIQLQHDLETLNISQHEIKGIISLLAAILLLNQAGVTVSPNAKPYFKNIEFAQKASTILGCKIEEIARIVFATPLQNRNSMRRSRSGSILSRSSSVSSQSSINRLKSEEKLSKTDENSSPKTNKNTDPSISSQILADNVYDVCVHALEGLLIGLYIEAFTSITRLVNRSLQTVSRTTTTMNILDGPGFQNKTILGLPGSYEDLTKNYCREKIQWFMHYCSFTATLDRYNRETVGVSYEVDASCAPSLTVQVLDKLTVDRRNESADAKGIFWIIEEEALRPNSNELILVEKIKTQHITNKGSSLVSVVPELPEVFTVSHLQNTVKVAYNVSGWLRKVREHPAIKMAYSLLTESSKTHISDLYAGHQSGAFQNESNTQARFVGRKRSQSILISVKKNAAVMTVKAQTERLLEQLDRTTVHFVHCFLPDTRAGLIDPNEVSDSQEAGNNFSFDIPYVRKQFKSSYLLENMRLHRLGYPEHIGYPDFRRRFDILLAKEDRLAEPVLDEKKVVSDMVKKLEIDERKYKLGLSQIFFRAGTLPQLEDSRDEKLSDTIIEFQALCRGYLGRKRTKKLQVQKTAIRCLQRNIRKYILVRNWEWWRLYTKVLPLLDVHRAERELLDKNSELGSLTSKINDLEGQNKTKDDENARLKRKVQEISSQLSAFHSSVSGTGELLEQEASERFRLEEELEQSKMETERLSKQCHQLESELCEMKLSAISNGNYPTESDDEADDANVWRDKYKALSRELESTRRRMTDQAEEEIQDLMSQKRSIEKQLTEEREESDEVRRQLQNSKRKLNKMTGEMEDMRLLLESVQGRNSDLEKKQKRFDTDVTGLHDQMESDRTQLDTLQRERDRMASEKNQLNNTVTQQEDEINQLKRKCERLTNELDDYGTSGKDDAELTTVRRMIRDLESKTQDQEEELDEQAGRIQQLEQAKLRLEMASQRDKQQFQRDMEMKDEDIEKMKSDCQRKIRDYEDQIQDEIQRKEEANKMKRDLERRIFDLQTTVEEVDRGTERKLKKELRKYRTLYRDAKKAAESQSMKLNEQPEIKSLRNQLEDADFAKHMALKAKQQIENDMEELHNQIEAITRMKETAEERCLALSRENSDFQSRIEEAEDELDEVIRKNKQLIAQLSEAQTMNVDLKERVNTLEEDKILLNEKINALSQKLEVYQRDMVDKTEIERLEIKLQEAENKWEVEAQSRIKLEHQVNRLKGQIERIQDDKTELQNSVSRVQQNHSRVERQMKENKMELDSLKRQEAELKRRREEAETNTQNMEDELSRKKTELTLAEKRIRLLQESMENDGFNSSDDEELFDEDSDTESISSSTSSRRRTSFRHSKRLSKRGSSDMSFETFSTSASQRRRRIPSDDYIFPNGGLGTNGSLYGTESTTTPGRYQSRTASRSISKRVSRQNSFE